MGQVGWGFVVDQANTSTGSASGEVGIAAASGGIYSPTLQTAGMGGSGVTNTYNGPLNNLLIRPYLFANGEQGFWYDPSDINLAWRRNLLTYTEQFDNATGWTLLRVTVPQNNAVSPDGTFTADILQENTDTNTHYTRYVTTTWATNTYTFSVFAKIASGSRRLSLNQTFGGINGYAIFDLQNGTVAATSGSLTASIQIDRNGYYRCSVTYTTTSTTAAFDVALNAGGAAGLESYTGDGTSGIYIWGAQLEVGSLTPYQQIVTPEITYVQDVQPLPILYQDAVGTTPVTAVEQPCSLMLDKRLGLVLGSELVTNGGPNIASLTNWQFQANASGSLSSGEIAVTLASSTLRAAYQDITTVIGKWYRVTVTARTANGSLTVGAYDTSFVAIQANTQSATGSNQTLSVYFAATATTTRISVFQSASGSSTSYNVVSASLRELPGNHAFTPAAASTARPTVSARVNLLTKTEQFDDAAWVKAGVTVSANTVVSPDGTLTGDKTIVASGLQTNPNIQQSVAVSIGLTYSLTLYVKRAELRYATFGFWFNATNFAGMQFDFDTATVSRSDALGTSYSLASASSVSVGNGWYRLTITGTVGHTSAFPAVVGTATAWTSGQLFSSQTGDGTSGLFIWGADLRVTNDGVGIPAYQRVNTATDYDTVGFPVYLRADGSNDYMLTNSIDFTGTDKMTICAGVRKLSDAARSILMELSSTTANSGMFNFEAPSTISGILRSYLFFSKGTLDSFVNQLPPASTAPTTNVLTGLGDISGDSAILRINGSQADSSTSDQGTGNYGNYVLNFFSRNQASLFFNGRFYGSVGRGAQSNDQQIAALEGYMNTKTKAY
jgi:hypothetical protein